jgi:hypothetical protein
VTGVLAKRPLYRHIRGDGPAVLWLHGYTMDRGTVAPGRCGRAGRSPTWPGS